MSRWRVVARAVVPAAPAVVYAVVADYREAHPRILPPEAFESLVVERGGVGAGTVIRVRTKAFGRVQEFLAEVNEPEPGRVLVERVAATGLTTTFTVEAGAQAGSSVVEFRSEWEARGLRGWIEGWLAQGWMRRVYRRELAILAEFVRGR
jgi:hypothetical protein